MANNAVKWDSEDPRDVKAVWGEYKLRVKAEHMGTIWKVTLVGPDNFEFTSEHTSRDAAKQKAAKAARDHQKTNTKTDL